MTQKKTEVHNGVKEENKLRNLTPTSQLMQQNNTALLGHLTGSNTPPLRHYIKSQVSLKFLDAKVLCFQAIL
jgi:hypothetical protein